MIAAVVLAAGASTRLGEPKQLVTIGGETLLERAVRTAREAGCAPVVVVLGAAAEQIRARCNLDGAVAVVNAAWQEGMASSIKVGVGAIGAVDAVVLMTCDQPAVTAEHLRALTLSGEMTASAYSGRRGIPACFPATMFAELTRLGGDAGARELLRSAAAVALTDGELDVDTASERDVTIERFG